MIKAIAELITVPWKAINGTILANTSRSADFMKS